MGWSPKYQIHPKRPSPTAQIKVCTLSFCVVWSNHPIYLYMAWFCLVWSNTTIHGMVLQSSYMACFFVITLFWEAPISTFSCKFNECHSGRLLAWTEIVKRPHRWSSKPSHLRSHGPPPLTTVDGGNSAPVEVSSLSHYLQGFIHPRWCRISSINRRNSSPHSMYDLQYISSTEWRPVGGGFQYWSWHNGKLK